MGGSPSPLISDEDITFMVTAATTRPKKLKVPFTRWSIRRFIAYLRGSFTKVNKAPHPDRLLAAYRRTHGFRYFHGCYCLGDETLWGINCHRKGSANTLTALTSIRATRPDGAPICVILDNLSANTTPAVRRWCATNNVELCLTPTYASWANPIEAHFGPLRMFTKAASNYPNHVILARDLQAHLRWCNVNARHPASWPPNPANMPASPPGKACAGAGPEPRPLPRPGGR